MKPAKEMTPAELYENFGGWVYTLAAKYRERSWLSWMDFDDLVNAGFLGLVSAQKTYDPAKGAFTTHCRSHIRRQFQILFEEIGPSSVSTPSANRPLTSGLAEERCDFNMVLDKVLEKYSTRDQEIFSDYHAGLTFVDLGVKYNISKSRAHMIVSDIYEEIAALSKGSPYKKVLSL